MNFTTKEVAEILDTADSTIRIWIDQQKLKANKFGSQWSIPEISVRNYISNERKKLDDTEKRLNKISKSKQ